MKTTLALVLFSLTPLVAQSADTTFDKISPTKVERGKTVEITATNLSTPFEVLLKHFDVPAQWDGRLNLGECLPKQQEHAGEAQDAKKNFEVIAPATITTPPGAPAGQSQLSVLVPEMVPLGEYVVCVYTANQANPVQILGDSGHLVVINNSSTPVQVTSVQKSVNYADANDQYSLKILGQGFSRIGPDNEILLDGSSVPINWTTACKSSCGKVVSTHELELSAIPQERKGPHKLQVRLGEGSQNLSESVNVTLSEVADSTPRWVALGVLAALVALVWLLLGRNRSHYEIDGKRISLLSALLLDQDTDTYSLSKAQFYAWTAAAIFGYAYLTLSRAWIQGHLEFSAIPDKLPGILLVSATTATVSLGMNSSKPKGASTVQPTVQDFITTGGIVAAERVQFLVWTVIGIATFLFLIWQSDPATISGLPAIPPEFLTLMGVSSAGYLGGRLVRKGGPIIDQILATISSLKLEIHGRNLSKDASFKIDGEDVKLDMMDSDQTADHRPQMMAPDDQQEPGFAKILMLSMATPKSAWLTKGSHPDESKRKHVLTIVNPDAQRADWPFSIAGPTAVITVGGQKVTDGGSLTVTPDAASTVALDGSASVADGDATITVYEWRFKDAPAILGSQNAQNIALPAGTAATVVLKVTDKNGRSDIATFTIQAAK